MLLALSRAVARGAVDEVCVLWVFLRDLETNDVALALGCSVVGRFGWDVYAFPVVAQRQTLVMSQSIELVDAIGGAEAAVCSAGMEERLHMGMVLEQSFRLTVWTMRATNLRTLIPL